MRDLLREVYTGELSEDNAEAVLRDATKEQKNDSCWVTLGLNNNEATAYLQGALFSEIANWRYNGWPSVCIYCGKTLILIRDGWFVQHPPEGGARLAHIDCMPNAR